MLPQFIVDTLLELELTLEVSLLATLFLGLAVLLLLGLDS
jgi:hypothetical protein